MSTGEHLLLLLSMTIFIYKVQCVKTFRFRFFFQSVFSRIFSPISEKYGPEKVWIWACFTRLTDNVTKPRIYFTKMPWKPIQRGFLLVARLGFFWKSTGSFTISGTLWTSQVLNMFLNKVPVNKVIKSRS